MLIVVSFMLLHTSSHSLSTKSTSFKPDFKKITSGPDSLKQKLISA